MQAEIEQFERIVRRASLFTNAPKETYRVLHPFDERNLHPALPSKTKRLFDDGHYAEATFEAFKFLDKQVQKHAGVSEVGFKLMMMAFADTSPLVKLNSGATVSEHDEQKGFQFLFSGAILAIRNPRGHEFDVQDDPDTCLDHLSLASLLIRKLESSGFKVT